MENYCTAEHALHAGQPRLQSECLMLMAFTQQQWLRDAPEF